MNLKVATVNKTDIVGGAAIAAYRIHHALRRQGIDSRMLVDFAKSDDWTVQGGKRPWRKASSMLRDFVGTYMTKRQYADRAPRSMALLPSSWPTRLNRSDADIVHLHWINGEMLSIKDITRFHRPVIWTLHDMWAFCGAEHYTDNFRWRDGYIRGSRPEDERGFDFDRWVWKRKVRHWKRIVHIVTPSRWLADCASASLIMRRWPVTVIPNAIDTDAWKPIPKAVARDILDLRKDGPLILFGAASGTREYRKGFDLLEDAIGYLRDEIPDLELVVFGQSAPKNAVDSIFPVRYAGLLHDEVSLRLLYSACDALVIPSRQDNLPNTGVEALACGLPIIAFDACGLSDLVSHMDTGYLARAYDPVDLAHGIRWLLSSEERQTELRERARRYAVRSFSYSIVANKYAELYEKVLGRE